MTTTTISPSPGRAGARPRSARWRRNASASASAAIASATGTTRGQMHGSWRPSTFTVTASPARFTESCGAGDRRRGLDRDARDDVLPGRDAAEDAAGVVGAEAVHAHRVVGLRAAQAGRGEARADLDALDRGDRQQRGGERTRRACPSSDRPSPRARRGRRPRRCRRPSRSRRARPRSRRSCGRRPRRRGSARGSPRRRPSRGARPRCRRRRPSRRRSRPRAWPAAPWRSPRRRPGPASRGPRRGPQPRWSRTPYFAAYVKSAWPGRNTSLSAS